MLWTPACPGCGAPSCDVGAVPDDGHGPIARGRIYIRWECANCGARPWLAESRFFPLLDLPGPALDRA